MCSTTTAIKRIFYKPIINSGRLKRLCRLVLLLPVVVGLAACSLVKTKSKEEALKDLEWAYQKDGIEIEVMAAPDLNMWGGQPHTLLMVVAQLEDPSAFEKHTQTPDKLSALLLADSAPDGVLTQQKHFVEPGSSQKFLVSRVEKAKYVALALGYQHLDPERSTRLYRIGADLDYSGLAFREYHAEPMPLRIQLLLGNESVQDSLTARKNPPEVVHPHAGLVEPPIRPALPPSTPKPLTEAATEEVRFSSPLPAPTTDSAPASGTQ